MTHDLVEQRKRELAEHFKDYPQHLLDEWYAIPEEYRDVRLKKFNIWPEIADIEESIKNGAPVSTSTVHMLFIYTDEDFLDFYFKDREEFIPAAAKYYAHFHKNLGLYYEYLEYGAVSIEEAEDKVMEFDGDIVITDPCYLSHNMSNEERRGFDCAYMAHYGIVGIESDTYYGDWSCTTYDRLTWDEDGHSKPIGEFCADSGMVCVADLKSVLKFNPKYNDHIEYPYCVTLVRNFKGTVRIKIEEIGDGNEIYPAYKAGVMGQGINTETGEPIEFYTEQTGL
jgi:hypothetical protein|nr:MAG TPA: Protein of unknown function (DUF4241) [Bacteriophage sp.]